MSPTTEGLVVEDLTVTYGGHTAVSRVSLEAPIGQLTGLIGPNGAGKTTIFNCCSGVLRPRHGRVWFLGRDVTHLSIPARADLGLGRTFQKMEIVNAMTVWANVALAAECRSIGANPFRQIVSNKSSRRRVAEVTAASLERCGISAFAGRTAGALSTGQRRLVELARAVAGDHRLLLLDEPSSGLDESETETFGRIVSGLVVDYGIGVLLVEHDMAMVMSTCEYIFVVEFGHLIFRGTPAEVQASDEVRRAYLGSEVVEARA